MRTTLQTRKYLHNFEAIEKAHRCSKIDTLKKYKPTRIINSKKNCVLKSLFIGEM